MEDILASIRRILNEDEQPSATAEPPPEPRPAAGTGGDHDGVLMLNEAMLVSPPAEPPPPAIQPAMPPPATPQPMPPPSPPAAAAPTVQATLSGLLDPGSAAAAKSSMGTLLRTLSSERTAQVSRGGVTIEDLVREEVRPLLKSWLDQHLPPLVERVVRQEIERLTGLTTP